MAPAQHEPSGVHGSRHEATAHGDESDTSLDAMLKRVLPDDAARLNSVQVALFSSATGGF